MHPSSSPLQFLPFPHTLPNKPQENSWINMFCFLYVTSHFQNTFGLSWSGFTTPFCPRKQPKLRQLLHLTGPCRSDIGVLLKAPITLPSADVYRVTSITLGNMRHMAMPKLGCWKLSVLQLFHSWKYTPGSGQGRVRSFKPCSWETTEMSS